MTKEKVVSQVEIGKIYNFKFTYVGGIKDRVIGILKSLDPKVMTLKILVNTMQEGRTPPLVPQLSYEAITEIVEIHRKDLPLFIGLRTTKEFEMLLRSNHHP